MKQFMILLKKDLMELYRTKKILIIVFIFLIFALLSPWLTKMTPELLNSLSETEGMQISMPDPTTVDSYAQFAGNISQLCMWTLVMVFGGLIVNERKKGLYTNLLNNGVKKHWFILSKLKSQIFVMTIVYIASALLFSLYNYIIFEEFFITNSLLSFLSLYVYLVFIICLVNLFSTIAKSTVMSIVLSFVTSFVIMFFDLFKFGKYLPNHLLSTSLKVLGESPELKEAYINIGITLAISIIIVIASIKLCNNKE